MRYRSGEVVEAGDHVLIEEGETPGRVYRIVETEAEIEEWGVGEPGLAITAEPFGLVFMPADHEFDPVIFVRRA